MTTPTPDLAAQLSTVLPAHLHHLIEPLTRYLAVAAELRSLSLDPVNSVAIAQAFAVLSGRELPLPTGASVSFGSGSNLGDVTMRDVAGRDLINLSITLPPPTPAPVPIGNDLDEGQLRILRELALFPDKRISVKNDEFAKHVGMSVSELKDELVFLAQRGLLTIKPTLGNTTVVSLTVTGRRMLRALNAQPPLP